MLTAKRFSYVGHFHDFRVNAIRLQWLYVLYGNTVLFVFLDKIQFPVISIRFCRRKAKEMYIQLRKERDYHRMHHRRVSQEKGKLIEELKRLKHHYEQYEPTLQQVKGKYEVALREKMLARLECERAVGQVSGLQNTLKNVDNLKRSSFSSTKGKPVFFATHPRVSVSFRCRVS